MTRLTRSLLVSCVLFACALLYAAPARAQGSGVLTGTVTDSATKKPLPDVVVTVTSPVLQGEQTVVTDKTGAYRVPNLPPGTYTLHFVADGFKDFTRGDIILRVAQTLRINVELLPTSVTKSGTTKKKSKSTKKTN